MNHVQEATFNDESEFVTNSSKNLTLSKGPRALRLATYLTGSVEN